MYAVCSIIHMHTPMDVLYVCTHNIMHVLLSTKTGYYHSGSVVRTCMPSLSHSTPALTPITTLHTSTNTLTTTLHTSTHTLTTTLHTSTHTLTTTLSVCLPSGRQGDVFQSHQQTFSFDISKGQVDTTCMGQATRLPSDMHLGRQTNDTHIHR